MRESGILMHITSLPSPYGVGTMGKDAYAFVDFLKAAGQSLWQILPVTPTGYGDSPYQSCSTPGESQAILVLFLVRSIILSELQMLKNKNLVRPNNILLHHGVSPIA